MHTIAMIENLSSAAWGNPEWSTLRQRKSTITIWYWLVPVAILWHFTHTLDVFRAYCYRGRKTRREECMNEVD